MMNIQGKQFFCSWSGGKDSCLALYHAIKEGGIPKKLLTMTENDERSRSHGLSVQMLNKQAELLGIPLVTYAATWENYEATFLAAMHQLKAEGIEHGIFGDIDLVAHREWVERVSEAAGIQPHLPLWQKQRRAVVEEFIAAGFKAMIVVINEKLCDRAFLGRMLDEKLLLELEAAGVDPAGEGGEFHTVVTGGPLFIRDLPVKSKEQHYHDGYWFLPLE